MKFFKDFFRDSFVIKIIIAIATFLFSILSNAQVSKDTELFKALQKNDSIIFESSFNNCNISDLDLLIDEDLEFYHDTAGITNGKEGFIKTVKQNICSNPKSKPLRKLVEGSLQVFPLYNNGKLYGAIQKGDHEFYLREEGKTRPTVVAKFTHLWLLKKNKWTLKRVLSYDHQPIQN